MSSPSADPEPRGSIRRTGPSALAAYFCVSLVLGWGIHYAARMSSGIDPSLTWPAAGLVLFLAAFLTIAAVRTRQARRDQVRLPAHRAVNLLVLGKACARAGAAVFGGYAGFGFGYLRADVTVAASQIVLVVLTCTSGLVLTVAGLALERACEIRDEGEQ